MIANILRYDLRNVVGVIHESEGEVVADYVVSHDDEEKPEPYSISGWNEPKLGPMKTITEYRSIGETAPFKAWIRNWYRARKIAHGNTPQQAEEKVNRAFPEN